MLRPSFDIRDSSFVISAFRFPLPWGCRNDANKLVRIRRLGPMLSARRIRFKSNCPSTKILVDQLRSFPIADHDDGPDALEMALRMASELIAPRRPDNLGTRLHLDIP